MFSAYRSSVSREALSPSKVANVEDLRRALEVARLYIDAVECLMAELQRENELLRQASGSQKGEQYSSP